MYNKLKSIAAAGLMLTASGLFSVANSIELLEVRTDVQHAEPGPALSALMEPIAPFVASGASSTANVMQFGEGNFASASTEGQANYAAIVQDGSRGRAVQAIQGSNSAALLVDAGIGNSVLQTSVGNNNFQAIALGQESRNNEVGYVQVGNNLAGALNLGSSKDSTVIALQTPGSRNYLMPTGINGLNNQVVVIVPGRMYVFKK